MDFSVDVSSQEIHLSDLQNGCPAIHFSPLHGRLSLGSVHQPQGEVTIFSKGVFSSFLSGHCLLLHPLGFSGLVLRTLISWELTFFNQVLAAIPFIAEFKLACDGGEVRGFKLQMEDKQGMQLLRKLAECDNNPALQNRRLPSTLTLTEY